MPPQFTLVTIVLIVVLYMPGYFFKRFYFQGKFAKQFGLGNFAERFITSVFWGILLQLLSFKIFEKLFAPDVKSIWKIISGYYSDISNNKIPDVLRPELNINQCIVYILGTIALSAILGALCHQIVCLFNIHTRFPVFRFSNEWHYYFSGLTGRSVSDVHKKYKVINTEMDVIVKDGSPGNLWYQGLLSEYTVSSATGDLELISLINVKRFSKTDNKFKDVPGDSILIPYSTIVNINFRFIRKKRRFSFQAKGEYMVLLNNVFLALFFLIFFLSPVFVFYLRFSTIGFWRSSLGSLFAWVCILFFGSTVSMSATYKKSTISNKGAVLTVSFGMMLLFAYLTYLTLK